MKHYDTTPKPKRNLKILKMKEDRYTYEYIGKKFGISKVRCWQIVRAIKKKLKKEKKSLK